MPRSLEYLKIYFTADLNDKLENKLKDHKYQKDPFQVKYLEVYKCSIIILQYILKSIIPKNELKIYLRIGRKIQNEE